LAIEILREIYQEAMLAFKYIVAGALRDSYRGLPRWC
jgi:hypothetical protein